MFRSTRGGVQTLDTVHYLKAHIEGMDPLTGGAKDIDIEDYISDPHLHAKKKRRGQPFPKLRRHRGVDVGEEEGDNEDEEEEKE